jgi:HD-GYP domain-containing protein (c-di-GMP phosphodiesterase class II)
MPSVPGMDLRSIAGALADFADLKSRYSAGHSRRTAQLARNAASVAGLDNAARDQIEIAALMMNIGMAGAPSGILEKPGPLSRTERETIEMHTVYTERILSSAEIFSDCVELACSHHERADRSGYHRRRGDLSLLEAILAASDVYVALTSARAWRPALSAEAAARELEALRERGALHARAVSVTLQAAGRRERRDYAERDALGLTAREQDVLRLVARGLTNKEIAAELGLSARTVQHHTIRIYEKLGVKSRAGATLQATLRGLNSV